MKRTIVLLINLTLFLSQSAYAQGTTVEPRPSPSENASEENDTSEYDASENDTSEYDASEYDASEYDASEYDASEYDASEYDASEYDASEYDASETLTEEYDTESRQNNVMTQVSMAKKQWPIEIPNKVARYNLIIGQMIEASIAGLWVVDLLNLESPQSIVNTIAGMGLSAGLASFFLTRNNTVNLGQATLYNTVVGWGLLNGVLIGDVLDSDIPSKSILIGYASGLGVAALIDSSDRRIHSGHMYAASSLGLWLGIDAAMFADKIENLSLTFLIASNAGFLGSLLLLKNYPISVSRMSAINLFGVLSGLLLLTANPDKIAFPLGSFLGLLSSTWLTKNWDDDWIPDEVSDMHLGVMPTEHGGMMGMVSGRF